MIVSFSRMLLDIVQLNKLEKLKKRLYYVIDMYNVNSVNKNIGKNVKLLRISRGLTQEQLAEAVGLERKSITAIETGRTFVSCESLVNFSNYFNVEPAFFFKQNFLLYTDKENDLQRKIISLTTGREEKELKKIYNILIASLD